MAVPEAPLSFRQPMGTTGRMIIVVCGEWGNVHTYAYRSIQNFVLKSVTFESKTMNKIMFLNKLSAHFMLYL